MTSCLHAQFEHMSDTSNTPNLKASSSRSSCRNEYLIVWEMKRYCPFVPLETLRVPDIAFVRSYEYLASE